MLLKSHFYVLFLLLLAQTSFAQRNPSSGRGADSLYRYRLSFPVIILSNLGQGGKRINTQHVEFHFKYEVDSKNVVGIKFATWRLFQPMGILWWDGLLDKVSSQTEFYPGYLKETGLGVSYQRTLWKGLFATVEALPLVKTYTDLDELKLARGFKLYTSYHVGYHIPFFKNRMFIEPQVHCQNWLIDTESPSGFKQLDDNWRKYFLFEPNLYLGVKF